MLKLMRDNFQQLKWALLAVVALSSSDSSTSTWASAAPAAKQRAGPLLRRARQRRDDLAPRVRSRALLHPEKQYEQMYRQPLTPEMIQAMGLPQAGARRR